MKTKIIYMVTSGEYSDYSVNALFSTREKAKNYIDAHEYKNNYSIDEIELDAENVPKGYVPFSVVMNKEGMVISVTQTSCVTVNFTYFNYNDEDLMTSECVARDKKHAVKIVNERRIKLIALDRYGYKNDTAYKTLQNEKENN